MVNYTVPYDTNYIMYIIAYLYKFKQEDCYCKKIDQVYKMVYWPVANLQLHGLIVHVTVATLNYQ